MISFARSSAKRLDLVTDGIDVIIAGERRVDLRAALEQLADRYGIRTVRTDSGGALNAALLEQGLSTR